MALIKLAAVGAAAYGLYRIITRQNTSHAVAGGPRLATARLTDPGAPTTSPNAPVGLGGSYVPPT